MPVKKKIKVVIADDNLFLGQALAENLSKSEQLEIVNVTNTIEDLILFSSENAFDILILDINFNGKSSLDYIDQIRPEKSKFKIIALTTLNTDYIKQSATDKGVEFFKGKDAAYDNFEQTVIKCFKSSKETAKRRSATISINNIKFTKTKIKILKGLYDYSGKTETEIATLLNISTSSLKTHKRQLYEMTSTNRIVDLIRFGFDNGIIIPK